MSRQLLPVILLLQSLLVMATNGLKLFPKQLHCSTTIYFTNKDSGDGTGSNSTNPIDIYQVEEYVDLDARRSTISVVDVVRDSTKIYYNLVGPPRSNGRSFTLYVPQMRSCEEQSIDDWTLATLRQVAINLHESIADDKREHVDVSIGPGSLLYAIANNLSGFVFKSSIFSMSKMNNIDVFAKEINYETLNGEESVNVIVHVLPRGRASPEMGDTLASIGDKISSMDIVLVGACKTGSRDNLESVESELTKEENTKGNKNDEPQQSQQHAIDVQLGADSFCDRTSLLFTIHYHSASLYKPGTLVGKSLEESGEVTGYNLQQEPFVLPVGIGCLSDGISSRPDWQKRLTRDSLADQFSAEYVSSYGEPGVSYVAYDEVRNLLRLDQAGRKSIYHIHSATSYHIGGLSAQFADQMTKLDKNDDDNRDKIVPQCIVLDMSDKTSPIPRPTSRKDIIGYWSGDNERYLGSQMLDHVNYDVFELEWTDVARLPLILRSAKFPGLKPTESKRLFLTYYAQAVSIRKLSDAIAASGQGNRVADQPEDVEIPLLSFVEVWGFDTMRKERRLINRVKFLDFSWDLDIEPEDAPTSQKPGPVDARVFDIEPCHQDRSAQAELIVKFSRQAKENATWHDELKDNRHIVSYADKFFGNAVRIHTSNLVNTKAKLLDSGDIVATARVVELRSGISTVHDLGLISYKQGDLSDEIVKIVLNRHSLEECRLESISVPSTDWFAYCPNLAVCLILKDSQQLRSQLKIGEEAKTLSGQHKQERSSSQDGVKWDVCGVELLRYKTVDVAKNDHNMLEQAFNFFHTSKKERYFRAFLFGSGIYQYKAIAYKQLDSLGSRLNNDVTLLSNLRYSTKEEDQASEELNTRVTAKTEMGAFRFCQLACQMDDFCGSFSMCSHPTDAVDDGTEQADCVLSTVRLTGERLNKIMAASVAASKGERLPDKQTSSAIGMLTVPDKSCSIHPKDFLADYHLDGSLRNYQRNPVHETDVQTEPSKTYKRHLDLEDCAGLSYERNLLTDNQGNATFWYCPLDSHCMADDTAKAGFSPTSLTEYCYVYERHPTRLYIMQPMTHMVTMKLESASSDQPVLSNVHKEKDGPISLQEKMDQLEKHIKSGTNHLATVSWALSKEMCAHSCNRHKSQCLAFDSCRFNDFNLVLCILYSRRSPAMRESAQFPMLKHERDDLALYRAELQGSEICNHYYLRDDYFEVRLNTMLDDEKRGFVAVGRRAIGELEEKIDLEDKRQSDEIVDSLIEDAKLIVEEEAENERRGPSGNQLIHWMSLIFGLVVGAVGILYRQHISEGLGRVNKFYRERRARTNSINDPVLTNQDI